MHEVIMIKSSIHYSWYTSINIDDHINSWLYNIISKFYERCNYSNYLETNSIYLFYSSRHDISSLWTLHFSWVKIKILIALPVGYWGI